MIAVRKSDQRGHTEVDWLDSRHTFSFGEYYDEAQMGFATLRVINEDRVRPGAGFPTHGHRDMEIITYILEGALEHRDSLGTGSVIRVGDVQRMSAGAGITHSEFNHSKSEPVHFLQIWILPSQRAIAPGYEQKAIDMKKARGGFHAIATPDGRGESVRIHQDAIVSVAKLEAGESVEAALGARRGWVQVARGGAAINGTKLATGDGAAITGESQIKVVADSPAEVLLFNIV